MTPHSSDTRPATDGKDTVEPGEKPSVNCAQCGGRAVWEKPWQTYMHWDEESEDTHAVVLPGTDSDASEPALSPMVLTEHFCPDNPGDGTGNHGFPGDAAAVCACGQKTSTKTLIAQPGTQLFEMFKNLSDTTSTVRRKRRRRLQPDV